MGTLHVIKNFVNDNDGIAVASDFSVHVKNGGIDVTGSPAAGAESPGVTYTLSPGTYIISEDAYANYTVSYSGESDLDGSVILVDGDDKTVTITNNDFLTNPQTGDNFWIGILTAV